MSPDAEFKADSNVLWRIREINPGIIYKWLSNKLDQSIEVFSFANLLQESTQVCAGLVHQLGVGEAGQVIQIELTNEFP